MKGGSFLLRRLENSIFESKTHSAWPESSVPVFLEYASRQFSFVTILQTSRLGGGLVAGYHSQPRFQLANPLFFCGGCGFTAGRRVAVLILPPLDAEMLVKLAQSQRVNGYRIWIQSQSTAGSGRSSMSPSRRLSNCEVNMLGWSALESE